MRSWTIRLDANNGWPPSMNARLHWRQRANQTKEWRGRTFACVSEAAIPRLERVRVSVVFHTDRGKALDRDNALARLKPCYDGLVGVWLGKGKTRVLLPGILQDDDDSRLTRTMPTEVRDGGKWIEMTIEELPANDLTPVGDTERPE